MDITHTEIWQSLQSKQEEMSSASLTSLFHSDPKRFQHFSLQAAGLFLDYSKNLIDDETLQLLTRLAAWVQLPAAKQAMFEGRKLNNTEARSAMHFALRQPPGTSLNVDGTDINAQVHETLNRMTESAQAIQQGNWRGYSGKRIKRIVTLGIGGSYLGPKTVWEALHAYHADDLELEFVANIDPVHIRQVLKKSRQDETLFIIVSKSFATLETLENAELARNWLVDAGLSEQNLGMHLIAVTANTSAASDFGVPERNIFPMWDWVGGRYSLWSAVGLPLMIGLGKHAFTALLGGAHEMDKHFVTAPAKENMPLILAMLGVWYHNFWHVESHVVLPYSHSLRLLPAHLQQLDMESNGKSVTSSGSDVMTTTSPIVWGSEGTNGQHAFHQLLHQGTRQVSIDFILPMLSATTDDSQQRWLVANCLSQAKALMTGQAENSIVEDLMAQGITRGRAEEIAPHKVMKGNKPSNTIVLESVNPGSLGSLLALYEHKAFCQGIIWQVNSFDQWGVELGKLLSEELHQKLGKSGKIDTSIDSSSYGLMQKYREFMEAKKR
jgi:glucose-6-phosphate isomerase